MKGYFRHRLVGFAVPAVLLLAVILLAAMTAPALGDGQLPDTEVESSEYGEADSIPMAGGGSGVVNTRPDRVDIAGDALEANGVPQVQDDAGTVDIEGDFAEGAEDPIQYDAASIVHQGTCGSCTWTIDANGLLTIKPTKGNAGTLAGPAKTDPRWPWSPYGRNQSNEVMRLKVAKGVKAGPSLAGAFSGFVFLEIDLSGLDASATTDMSSLFEWSYIGQEGWKPAFDTSNVTTMKRMFMNASGASFDLSALKTPKVSDVSQMFEGSSFHGTSRLLGDCRAVTNASRCFYGTDLAWIDLGNWGAQVKKYDEMFSTSPVQEILIKLNNQAATCKNMFAQCNNLELLRVGSKWDTSKAGAWPKGRSNKWWSTADKKQYTEKVITSTRKNTADTYTIEKPKDRVYLTLNGKRHNVMERVWTIDITKKDTRFTLDAMYKGHNANAEEFILYQGTMSRKDKVIATAGPNGSFGEIPYSSFSAGKKVFIQAITHNGLREQTNQLCITVKDSSKERTPASFELNNKGLTFTAPGGTLKGMKIQLPLMSVPVKAKVDDDGTLTLGINWDPNSEGADEFINALTSKKLTKRFWDVKENYDFLISQTMAGKYKPKEDGKFQFEVVGYVKGDALAAKYEGVVMVKVGYRASLETQHLAFFVIPVVTDFSVGVGGTLKGTGRFEGSEKLSSVSASANLVLNGSLEYYAGLGIVGLSGGFYGAADPYMDFALMPTRSAGLEKAWIEGRLGLRFIEPIFGEHSIELFGGEQVIYSRDKSSGSHYGGGAAGGGDDWSIGRSYLSQTTSWGGTHGLLQGGVYPGTDVQMVASGYDSAIMVFTTDDSTRNAANRTMLVWSQYDPYSTTWSAPQPVLQDGTADYHPSIVSDGSGGAYVVWQNARSVISDDMSGEATAAALDISVAHIDENGEVTNLGFVTDDSTTYESMPAIGFAEGQPVVTWSSNALSQLHGLQGTHQIFKAIRNGNGWNSTAVYETTDTVTALSAGSLQGSSIAWSTDADGVLNSMEDSRVFVESNGEVIVVAEGNAWCPLYVEPGAGDRLVWWEKNTLSYRTHPSGGSAILFDEMPLAEYKIAGDLTYDGLVTYVRGLDESTDLVGRKLIDGEWSSALNLTKKDDNVSGWGAGFVCGEPLAAYSTMPAGENVEMGASLWSARGEDMKFISITDAAASGSYQSADVEIAIENTGLTTVEPHEISFSILDPQTGEAAWEDEGYFGYLEPGESADEYLYITDEDYPIGENPSFVVAVSPGGTDSTAEVVVEPKSNISVEAENQIIDGKEQVVAHVESFSIQDDSATVTFYDFKTGNILQTIDIADLSFNTTSYLGEPCYQDSFTFAASGNFFRDEGISVIGVRVETPHGVEDEMSSFDFVRVWDGGALEDEERENTAPISKATVETIPDQKYTGQAITPEVIAKLGKYELEEGVDYTLSYKNNVKQGTATVILTGKGYFTGTKSVTFKIVAAPKPSEEPVPVYRLYNKKTSEHLYTINYGEFRDLPKVTKGDWVQEGIAWYAPKKSNTPVYRLYNKRSGDHHYTTSKAEADALVKKHGWTLETTAFYSDDAKRVPLYRLYNGRLKRGQHHYTADANERNALSSKHGWKYETIGFYGVKR